MAARAASPRLTWPAVLSLVLHGGLVALALVLSRDDPPQTLPPVYRVNIVAAPPGPRQMGEVRPAPPTPAPEPEPEAPPPPRAETPPPDAMPAPAPPKAPPRRQQTPATPNPAPERPKASDRPAPRAGGGPTGGRGTDVATVRTEGVDFPYPGYLNNIVRQIALRFRPEPGTTLSAEVMFLIHRDGTVSGFRFVRRSGDYAFDLEAQGAVEAASGAFGELPAGFQDDVLPVFFSFDPRVIR